jgi:hypothetical protein
MNKEANYVMRFQHTSLSWTSPKWYRWPGDTAWPNWTTNRVAANRYTREAAESEMRAGWRHLQPYVKIVRLVPKAKPIAVRLASTGFALADHGIDGNPTGKYALPGDGYNFSGTPFLWATRAEAEAHKKSLGYSARVTVVELPLPHGTVGFVTDASTKFIIRKRRVVEYPTRAEAEAVAETYSGGHDVWKVVPAEAKS